MTKPKQQRVSKARYRVGQVVWNELHGQYRRIDEFDEKLGRWRVRIGKYGNVLWRDEHIRPLTQREQGKD